jgi:hypothetical protein
MANKSSHSSIRLFEKRSKKWMNLSNRGKMIIEPKFIIVEKRTKAMRGSLI